MSSGLQNLITILIQYKLTSTAISLQSCVPTQMVLMKNVVELGVKLARKYTIRAHGRKHPLSQLLTSELAKEGLTCATRQKYNKSRSLYWHARPGYTVKRTPPNLNVGTH